MLLLFFFYACKVTLSSVPFTASSVWWRVSSVLRVDVDRCSRTKGENDTSSGKTSVSLSLSLSPPPLSSPLPVRSPTDHSCSIPVPETTALEEQVAAGHRSHLARLLHPGKQTYSRIGKNTQRNLDRLVCPTTVNVSFLIHYTLCNLRINTTK